MMFFAQSNVVEKGVRVRDLPYQRIDAVTGAVVGCIVAWFIIVTTGTVLFPQHRSRKRRSGCSCARTFRGPIR